MEILMPMCALPAARYSSRRQASDAIDAKAKELGLWGLEKKGKIGYSGNSLIVRIPKRVAEFMKLKKGEDIVIKPEDKRRLVIEVE